MMTRFERPRSPLYALGLRPQSKVIAYSNGLPEMAFAGAEFAMLSLCPAVAVSVAGVAVDDVELLLDSVGVIVAVALFNVVYSGGSTVNVHVFVLVPSVPKSNETWPVTDLFTAGHVPVVIHEAKSVVEPSPVRVFVGMVTTEFAQLPAALLHEYVRVYVVGAPLFAVVVAGVIVIAVSAAYAGAAPSKPTTTSAAEVAAATTNRVIPARLRIKSPMARHGAAHRDAR